MTPLQTIRAGILNNNMTLVAEGYNRIVPDDQVQPPAVRRPPQDTPRARAQAPIDDEYADFRVDSIDVGSIGQGLDGSIAPQKKEGDVACRAEPFVPRKRNNMFFDDGETPVDYSEADEQADKAAKRKAQAPRPKPYVPVTVSCQLCGNRYNVNPYLAPNGKYTCDKCNKRR